MKRVVPWIIAGAAAISSHANAQLSAQLLPERSSFEDVFAASNRFYPGQRLLIRVEGQVDANHRYWQDRECSWFGLKCKYVNREASNLMGVGRLPVLLNLEPVDGLTAPQHTYQGQWYGNPNAQHLPVSTNGAYDIVIEVPNAGNSVDAFGTGRTLRGVVADKYDGSAPINRGQCHNRPPTCSSGAYKVVVAVDNSRRVQLLDELLRTPRAAADIVNRQVMDPLFVQDPIVKSDIAGILFDHARQHHNGQDDDARRGYLKIISYASELDPTRADILNEIARTYIALGEFTQASAEVQKALQAAQAKYDAERPPKASTVTDLARTLSLKASIWTQERAGVVGSDLIVAVGLYRKAAGLCGKEADNASSKADKQALYACAKDHLVDAGRNLAMLRSRDNLILAEQLLTQAQDAARRSVDAK